MLDATSVNQLEAWLGEGPLTLTNLFTKDASDPTKNDSRDWHAAVDGAGRTFSLWEVVTSNGAGGVDNFIFGGYNPQSWSSAGSYNFTTPDAERTAFIFNLTTGTRLDQCKSTDNITCGYDFDSSNFVGRHQTYNNPNYGPTFGGGLDLYVNFNLSRGWNYTHSYGNPAGDAGHGAKSPLDNNNSNYGWIRVGTLETFGISPYAVPEPGTLALFGLGLAGIGFARRKKA